MISVEQTSTYREIVILGLYGKYLLADFLGFREAVGVVGEILKLRGASIPSHRDDHLAIQDLFRVASITGRNL